VLIPSRSLSTDDDKDRVSADAVLLAYKSGTLVLESDKVALFWGGHMKEAAIPESFEDQLEERIYAWSDQMPDGRLWVERVRTSSSTLTKL
jgi:hypothetical protein